MGFEDEVEQSLGRLCRYNNGRSKRTRRSHAAATSRLQRNSVPSTQMRCMITANRRAKATIAFFSPRCVIRRNFRAGHPTRSASSAGRHGHASPRGMRCGYALGQWSVHTYFRPSERRQVCGWDAFSGWPLR